MELSFTPAKLGRVDSPSAAAINLFRNNRMQHFVVNNVFKEPGRNKRSIQAWMYPNDFVLLLNRAEDEIFFGGIFPFAAPGDCVALERIAEVFGIHFLE
jgi:hypothetical protein